ncbi:MAG: type I-B CRISPR-associated protein Cas7/Csh2 [Candidatus Margulisbacteria bacterium GWF2_35_9]|nr:MAG: type I-B CRISPR-associated protein Cas7/Csh2 [Candidatus Margulisbacteria bacterium GWF2_35_9]
MNELKNRSELLFLYDVKDCNPNGDPMDENKPRIDEETRINIVTDVRLKRTIRDYLYNFKGYDGTKEKDIFCRQTEAEKDGVKGGINDGKGRAENFGITKEEKVTNILGKCIDVRLFGGVIPLDKDSITYTGPVQFKMGRSLHQVELKHLKGTGAFASKAGANQQTFREEYVLPYSLIAFYGVINENAAKYTGLTEEDASELVDAMWSGTKNLLSRSKMGHSPRLLIRVIYKEANFFIGELDKLVIMKTAMSDEKIRDISEVEIDLQLFTDKITKNKEKILKIILVKGDRCKLINYDSIKNLIEEKTL